LLADAASTPESLGDEPFQMHQKFPAIQVAVDANRKNGIEKLLSLKKKPELILLDDAFQHRKVKAGFYILLTAYSDLYSEDFILPTGNLRESRKRANIIVVTKCPTNLSEFEQNKCLNKLKVSENQVVYFSTIAYDESLSSEIGSRSVASFRTVDKLLVAGIAKPKPFFAYLQSLNDEVLDYPDHHDFSETDIQTIINKAKKKPIITTEKDYVRLKGKLPKNQLFFLPIQSSFLSNSDDFNKKIIDYVGQSSRNR
jgi:tetraacyldisaccharide 4'-kinase